MMLPVEHTKLAVTLLDEKKTNGGRVYTILWQLRIHVCTCTCMFGYEEDSSENSAV